MSTIPTCDVVGVTSRPSETPRAPGQKSRKRRRYEIIQTSSPTGAKNCNAAAAERVARVELVEPSMDVTEEAVHFGTRTPTLVLQDSQPDRQANVENSIESASHARDVHRERTSGILAIESRGSKSPTAAYLLNALPQETMMVIFLEEYFSSVHWFSLVIYEPSFRQSFDSIRAGFARPSQRPFLLLLSVVLGLGAWYRGQRPEASGEPSPTQSRHWSEQLMSNAESRIIEILDQSSMTAVQTLTLLGSFFVYHGRPNLSFSLLGATVKSAQAAGLHEKPTSTSHAEIEERKRVWWTIYTWDRFASITYGRPISIDENDCNVAMPSDVYETVDFQDVGITNRVSICFSSYQRELNKLYMIASPAIKQVYNSREAVGPARARTYVSLVEEVTDQLWQWRRTLPNHLSLDLSKDCGTTPDPGRKAHHLQSLSLHLTFDSLLIILHRPFLKTHLSALRCHGLEGDHGLGVSGLQASGLQTHVSFSRSSSEDALPPPGDTSQEQWWKAAARTAKVVELPQLAQFASDGHLVAFLAINLFNAAIVMIVLALSDPLTNRAQEAKRAVARIYRLQGRLGARSKLSTRSLVVLRNLVVLLSQRESDAILAPAVPNGYETERLTGDLSPTAMRTMSVRDTLTMPIGASLNAASRKAPQAPATADTQLAVRLDDSLASVQRAITGHANMNINKDVALQSDPLPAEDGTFCNMNDLSQYEGGAATVSSDWSTGPADASNGLYWFWDAGWDQLYSDCFTSSEPATLHESMYSNTS